MPADWTSGVYALHLEKDGARDNIVFYVRAAIAGLAGESRVPGADLLLHRLRPVPEGGAAGPDHAALAGQWGALAQAPDGHPEYGVSPYNFHSDGSGVVMSTMRRPLIDKRVNQIHLVDPSPDGSGLYWIAADSFITDLLTARASISRSSPTTMSTPKAPPCCRRIITSC